MTDTTPEDGSGGHEEASTDQGEEDLVAESRRYLQRAADQPDRALDERDRLVELLTMDSCSKSTERALERRAAASGALANCAHHEPAQVADSLTVLVSELQKESARQISDKQPELRDRSRAIRDHLVSSIAGVIADDPDTTLALEEFETFTEALTTDRSDEALRVAARALFAYASDPANSEQREALSRATDRLEELLAYPDTAVQAWSAGTLGALAEEIPAAVAPTAGGLRSLLHHDNETVQHNAVEALAALVDTHPETVAPASDALRNLLTHDETALQHNAAGVMGRLAETHPDAVSPAVEELQTLCTHEEKAVRRIATGALARVAQARQGSDSDG